MTDFDRLVSFSTLEPVGYDPVENETSQSIFFFLSVPKNTPVDMLLMRADC